MFVTSCGHDKVEYFYFDFANGVVEPSDWREPDALFYSGDKVPSLTKVSWNGAWVQALDVDDCCVPVVEILSPVSLSNIIVKNGAFVTDYDDPLGSSCVAIHRIADDNVELHWNYWPEHTGQNTCIRVGDEVSIELIPENGAESLTMNAVLVRSGYYRVSNF